MAKEISAGFIVKGKDGRFLLGKAERHEGPFSWSVFKGGQENDEGLINTAIRELKEETGIDIAADERLNRNISHNYVYCYKMRHKDVYLFFLDDKQGALEDYDFCCDSYWGDNNDIPEISDWQWYELDEMEDFIFPSQRGVVAFLKSL